MAEEYAASLNTNTEEKWFNAEEGLHTVNTLLRNLEKSKPKDVVRVEAELGEFVRVLEFAKAKDIRWHLGIDY